MEKIIYGIPAKEMPGYGTESHRQIRSRVNLHYYDAIFIVILSNL